MAHDHLRKSWSGPANKVDIDQVGLGEEWTEARALETLPPLHEAGERLCVPGTSGMDLDLHLADAERRLVQPV